MSFRSIGPDVSYQYDRESNLLKVKSLILKIHRQRGGKIGEERKSGLLILVPRKNR